MSPPGLAEGTLFAGRYRVIRCIAAGGMGAVYEVVHLETERHRALKIMHAQLLHSDDLRNRFRQEARVAAQIESLHIVDVFDAGIDEPTGMPFLVMELLRGEDLGKKLRQYGRFTAEEVVTYLHQAALALDKTHRARIVHRDLKPDNLFLCEYDEGPPRIKVLDFGIAKLVAESSTQANATRSMGTPLYMAPEQFRSDSGVSSATDIFALGMIAYTLLVGVPYWREDSQAGGNVYAFTLVAAQGPKEAATARAQRQGMTLPPSFDAWFARATAFSPGDRFASASDAVQELARVLGVHGAATTNPGALGQNYEPAVATPFAASQPIPFVAAASAAQSAGHKGTAAMPAYTQSPGIAPHAAPPTAVPMSTAPPTAVPMSTAPPMVMFQPAMPTPTASGVTAVPVSPRTSGKPTVLLAATITVAFFGAGAAGVYGVWKLMHAPSSTTATPTLATSALPEPLPAASPPPAPTPAPSTDAASSVATAAPSASSVLPAEAPAPASSANPNPTPKNTFQPGPKKTGPVYARD